MRIYDLSGVKSEPKNSTELKKHNSQWKGLTEYKKKWGGDELEYYHLIKTRKSTVYKLFRLLSRARRRTAPSFFLSKSLTTVKSQLAKTLVVIKNNVKNEIVISFIIFINSSDLSK